MYGQSAHLYDLLNAATGKNYGVEAATVMERVRQLRPTARSLLDVACGTGAHLEHFQRTFEVEGVEPEPEMRVIAQRRLPDVPVHDQDMRHLDFPRRFDIVTCLFSAIGYMHTQQDLHAAVASMAAHLEHEGLLIVEPWFRPEQWIEGHTEAVAANDEGISVARVSRSERRGHLSGFTFHFVVADTAGVETFTEPHELALWALADYEAAFQEAGLQPEVDEVGISGRGLLIGRAPR